jgi:ubiquitin carboxyl-terminal hydrolase 7
MAEVANEHLRKVVSLAPTGGSGMIRIFDILSGRIQRPFTGSEAVRDVNELVDLMAEVRFFEKEIARR